MKQALQPAGRLLGAAANQGDDQMRTQKTVPMDEPDGRSFGGALKTRKASHPASMKALP